MKFKLSFLSVTALVAGAGLLAGSAANALADSGQQDTSPPSANVAQTSDANQNNDNDNTQNNNAPGNSGTANLGTIVAEAPVQRSLSRALQNERQSPQIVGSIVAEDIGKLPDTNLADALQRITGVQTAYGAGETASVLVRGLPDVVTSLNGRQLFTGSGRGFAYQDLPATAIREADVYKSSSADMLNGGIAGHIDIRLARPLDFDHSVIAASVKDTWSTITHHGDPSGSLLLSDRWDTDAGEFGALFNIGYITQHFGLPALWNGVTNPYSFTDGTVIGPDEGAVHTRGYRKRGEANYALQWKPNDNLEFYNEGIFDMWRSPHHRVGFFFATLPTADSVTDVTTFPSSMPNACYEIDGQQACEIKSGTFHNPYTASSTQAQKGKTNTWQDAIGMKWNQGPWKVSSDLSFTRSFNRTHNFIIDQYLKDVTVKVDTNKGGHANPRLVGNPQLDPGNYYLNALFQDWYEGEGKQWAWRGKGEYDFEDSPISKLQFGFRIADHKASEGGAMASNTPPPDDARAIELGENYLMESPPNLPYLERWFTGNTQYMLNHRADIRSFYGAPAGEPPADPARQFHADETKYIAYLQAGYNFDIGNVPVDGLFGVRAINTHRDLNGFTIKNDQAQPANSTTNKTTTLPNFSARVHLTDNLQLRLSYSESLSFPAFPQLNPATTLTPPTVNRPGYGSGGNPDLTPIKSDNYDLGAAWYFGRGDVLRLTAFHRSISGYIESYTKEETYGGIDYRVTRPRSSGTGHLNGAEFSYQQFFHALPAPLDGLGLELNYTYIKGQTKSPKADGSGFEETPFPQVSRNTYNAILIYEKFGFSFRLAYNYRSRYIDNISVGGVQQPNYLLVDEPHMLNLGVTYNITDNLSVAFDATNLTGSQYHSYNGNLFLPHDIRPIGKTYSVGLRAKF